MLFLCRGSTQQEGLILEAEIKMSPDMGVVTSIIAATFIWASQLPELEEVGFYYILLLQCMKRLRELLGNVLNAIQLLGNFIE